MPLSSRSDRYFAGWIRINTDILAKTKYDLNSGVGKLVAIISTDRHETARKLRAKIGSAVQYRLLTIRSQDRYDWQTDSFNWP